MTIFRRCPDNLPSFRRARGSCRILFHIEVFDVEQLECTNTGPKPADDRPTVFTPILPD
jgi:hypothetical protein